MIECASTSHAGVAPHGPACGCIPSMGRRGVFGLLAAGALAAPATAATGNYEAMLLNCIDPRFTTGSFNWMGANAMRDRYSQFTIAGGPLGVVHPRFATWQAAFWENLDISVQLHNIKQVVGMTHRDCGAAKLALGEGAVSTRALETASHAEALRQFQAEVARRQPGLTVLGGIMDLDGQLQRIV